MSSQGFYPLLLQPGDVLWFKQHQGGGAGERNRALFGIWRQDSQARPIFGHRYVFLWAVLFASQADCPELLRAAGILHVVMWHLVNLCEQLTAFKWA